MSVYSTGHRVRCIKDATYSIIAPSVVGMAIIALDSSYVSPQSPLLNSPLLPGLSHSPGLILPTPSPHSLLHV